VPLYTNKVRRIDGADLHTNKKRADKRKDKIGTEGKKTKSTAAFQKKIPAVPKRDPRLYDEEYLYKYGPNSIQGNLQ
jgi:hypothetical protein